jgi:DNA-binding transcriptional LysR family regulator
MLAHPNIRFTLRQLQFFAAVARTRKISSAAVECHVTQSTMTAAIAELERALGTLLFDRGRNGVELTYHGHLFLQRATAVLEIAGDAARNPFQERGGVTGTLEIAASYTVLGYFLLPLIARFQQQHPGVRIVPVERGRVEIESAITAGEIELAVALTSNMGDMERFERQPLTRSRRQLWVAADHPLTKLPIASLQEVAAYPYILPMVDEGNIAALGYWQRAGLQPASFLHTSSMEAVREMVALGLAVTILSDMIFRPWSLDGRRLKTMSLTNDIPPMEVGLIWKKGQPLSPIADALRRYLEVASSARPDT